MKTPAVERDKPFAKTGLIWLGLTLKPPIKRINAKDTIPTDWAILKSSKYIPPNPSEPAKIPTKIKSNNEGIPNFPPNLLNNTAISSKTAVIKRM